MRGVDLSRYVFDFDLTFAALTMHPDGRIYHRYGSRDSRAADVWLSSASLEFVLQESARDHAKYDAKEKRRSQTPSFGLAKAKVGKPVVMEGIPSYQKRDKGMCIHCHSIHPAFYEEAIAAKTWQPEKKWVYPDPSRMGVDLDADQQRLIINVVAKSPAEKAGLKRGDQITRLNNVSIASAADLMFALDGLPGSATTTQVEIQRDDITEVVDLKLGKNWKVGTPQTFAWRPFKWGLTPAPGFGGPQLSVEELAGLNIKTAFAFRVQYLVTWNENRRYGQAAAKAGLHKGDVVLSLSGKSDFDSVEHFHSWWRLTRKVGETVKIEILRNGKRDTLDLKVVE